MQNRKYKISSPEPRQEELKECHVPWPDDKKRESVTAEQQNITH